MFVSTAYAQATPAAGSAFDPTFFMPLVLIFVVFYFLLIRPQQKKVKQHREMIAALRRGDRVVTSGGLIGTIAKVASDSEVMIDIAEGVRIRVLRSAISDVLTKPEPVSSKSGDDAGSGKDQD